MKYCLDCKRDLPETEFHCSGSKISTRCKNCHNQRSQRYSRKRNHLGLTNVRATQLRTKYGIEPVEYEMMLRKQGNKCLICGLPFTEKAIPCVDHIELPFHVRGLLHQRCNLLVPSNVTPDLGRAIVTYLETNDKRFLKSKGTPNGPSHTN